MSGPVLIFLTGDILGSQQVNTLAINDATGAMGIYIDPLADSQLGLSMGAKLTLNEEVCAIANSPYDKGSRTEKLVPVCDRVLP